MGFESAHQNMEAGIENAGESTSNTSSDAAPESSGSSGSQHSDNNSDSPSIQEIIDLDKVEKFKMHGEEWTRDKLASSMLRQADYTRKTQELGKDRQTFANEQKFYDNLAYDIANVLKDPALVAKFKETYPEKFHQYLEPYSGYLQTKQGAQEKSGAQQGTDPQFMARLNQVEGKFRQQEVKAAEVMLDGIFKQYQTKYPFADEASVISKSLALMEQKQRSGQSDDLSNDDWNRVFRSENDRVQKLAETQYKNTVTKQLTANRKAKDIGTGGDAVGQSPKKMTMKEATEAAIRDLGGR